MKNKLFVDFLNTLKTDTNKTFIESVVEKGFKTLFEYGTAETGQARLPTNPKETELVMATKLKEAEDLKKLQQTQESLIKTETDLDKTRDQMANQMGSVGQ
jgi:septin family protein